MWVKWLERKPAKPPLRPHKQSKMRKNLQKIKQAKRGRREARVRTRTRGAPEQPRLAIFRSAKHIYAQVIDDTAGRTLVAAGDLNLGKKVSGGSKESGKIAIAREIGKLIARRAISKGITKVVFDRGSYKYHGRVKALAEGAREGGLQF